VRRENEGATGGYPSLKRMETLRGALGFEGLVEPTSKKRVGSQGSNVRPRFYSKGLGESRVGGKRKHANRARGQGKKKEKKGMRKRSTTLQADSKVIKSANALGWSQKH